MQLVDGRGQAAASPFWAGAFRLVSLKELFVHFSEDEFQFGPFANVAYLLGRLDAPVPGVSESDLIQIQVLLNISLERMEHFGFRVSASSTRDLIAILDGTHPSSNLHDYILIWRAGLMKELEATLFLPVEYSVARFYREPRRDWEEVISRFPEAIDDIEEAGKLYALGRYPASVYHSMQIIEFGLLELGRFMKVNDPKSGFTAVSNALEQLLKKPYGQLSDFDKQHRSFFEQINFTVQSVKNACRNKISHAEGRAVLMTSDFSPHIAMEIYTATRGFMRRLATELPL